MMQIRSIRIVHKYKNIYRRIKYIQKCLLRKYMFMLFLILINELTYSQYIIDRLISRDMLMQQGKQIIKSQLERLQIGEERKHLTPEGPEDPWFDSSQSQDDLKSNQQENVTLKIQQKVAQKLQQMPQNQQMVKNEIKKEVIVNYETFDHNVDHKYIILLIVMNSRRLINVKEISGLKRGYIDLYGKFNKVSVKTVNQQDAKAAINKISDYIDNLNVQKLNICGQAAYNLQNFRKLKQSFRKLNIVIFGYKYKNTRQLLIGGQMKPSQLKLHAHHLKQYKINSFQLRAMRNTRTYKIIIDQILEMKQMKSVLAKAQINLCQVQLFNKMKNVLILYTAVAGKKQYTPNEYEDCFMKQIKNFYVIIVILDIYPQYIEKLVCENISLKYIRQKKLKRSELIIVGHRDHFMKNLKVIKQYLQKIDKHIIGLRYFYHICPTIKHFQINREKYYFNKFPQQNPYSYNIYKNRSYGQGFDWRSLVDQSLNVNIENNKKQQEL